MTEKKPFREGSMQKRVSILKAARDLFLMDGYLRSSVDSVAARAGVSKRTVYDYYGDKRGLLLAVLQDTGQSLMVSIRGAIEQNLTDADDLELALMGFATQIANDAFLSSDYAVLRRLFMAEADRLPELHDLWVANAPEDALAERFAELAEAGLLQAPNSRLAAEHFVALTFLLALNNTVPGSDMAAGRVEQAIIDGVPVFLRAYGPR